MFLSTHISWCTSENRKPHITFFCFYNWTVALLSFSLFVWLAHRSSVTQWTRADFHLICLADFLCTGGLKWNTVVCFVLKEEYKAIINEKYWRKQRLIRKNSCWHPVVLKKNHQVILGLSWISEWSVMTPVLVFIFVEILSNLKLF